VKPQLLTKITSPIPTLGSTSEFNSIIREFNPHFLLAKVHIRSFLNNGFTIISCHQRPWYIANRIWPWSWRCNTKLLISHRGDDHLYLRNWVRRWKPPWLCVQHKLKMLKWDNRKQQVGERMGRRLWPVGK